MKKLLLAIVCAAVTFDADAVSLSFTKAYLGVGTSYALQTNSISIASPINSSLFQFKSLNPADVTFSGNNVAGTLTYSLNSSVTVTRAEPICTTSPSASTVQRA